MLDAVKKMLTKKLNRVFVVSLVALCVVIPVVIPQNLPYKTHAEKSVAGYQATAATSFSIPDSQCSGFIDESLLCGLKGVAGSVKVVVQEATSFASVHINRLLHNVTILRGRDAWGKCQGQAEVDVFVGCLIAPPRSQRRRRFIHTLPEVFDMEFLK